MLYTVFIRKPFIFFQVHLLDVIPSKWSSFDVFPFGQCSFLFHLLSSVYWISFITTSLLFLLSSHHQWIETNFSSTIFRSTNHLLHPKQWISILYSILGIPFSSGFDRELSIFHKWVSGVVEDYIIVLIHYSSTNNASGNFSFEGEFYKATVVKEIGTLNHFFFYICWLKSCFNYYYISYTCNSWVVKLKYHKLF